MEINREDKLLADYAKEKGYTIINHHNVIPDGFTKDSIYIWACTLGWCRAYQTPVSSYTFYGHVYYKTLKEALDAE